MSGTNMFVLSICMLIYFISGNVLDARREERATLRYENTMLSIDNFEMRVIHHIDSLHNVMRGDTIK